MKPFQPSYPIKRNNPVENKNQFSQNLSSIPTQSNLSGFNKSIQSPSSKSEVQFYSTIRRYTERIKEERDLSLSYLNKINELTEVIRLKDMQIQRLNQVNKELTDKLGIYTSVLEKSGVKTSKTSMHISMLVDKKNMTESIIQTKEEYLFNKKCLKPFEQFFIADVSKPKSDEKSAQNLRMIYLFDPENTMEEILNNYLRNEGDMWELQPFGSTSAERKPYYCFFISNSIFTTQRGKKARLKPLDNLNPSYYYFITCIVQKQIVCINGRYFWSPIAYGFISMLPFPEYFFNLLEQIVKKIKIKNQGDRSLLTQSLLELQKCQAQFSQKQSPRTIHYKFLNSINNWNILSGHDLDHFVLNFSVPILEQFALELVIDVLILLLLEIPITIISENELLLSKFMFYFIYIIKPLKYPYPIIFNLTQKYIPLLQSPFPTFTGVTNSTLVDPYLNERAVFDLDNKAAKSWPMLSHLDISRQFLMKWASKAGNFSKLNILTEEIICGHQYKELQPYWKDFSCTQIYKNYVYQN